MEEEEKKRCKFIRRIEIEELTFLKFIVIILISF